MESVGLIPSLNEAELDALPQGVIRLDKSGTILYYSPIQAELSQRTIATTLGLNFFTDVAPCTAVNGFQGRFNDFIAAPPPHTGLTEVAPSFKFTLRFAWGTSDVSITMVKTSGPDPDVYLVVERE